MFLPSRLKLLRKKTLYLVFDMILWMFVWLFIFVGLFRRGILFVFKKWRCVKQIKQWYNQSTSIWHSTVCLHIWYCCLAARPALIYQEINAHIHGRNAPGENRAIPFEIFKKTCLFVGKKVRLQQFCGPKISASCDPAHVRRIMKFECIEFTCCFGTQHH